MSSKASNGNEAMTPFGESVNDLAKVFDTNKQAWHPANKDRPTNTAINQTIKPQIDAIKAFGRGALDYIMRYAKDNNVQSKWYTTYADLKEKGRGISGNQHHEICAQAFILWKRNLTNSMAFGDAPSNDSAIDPFADSTDDPLLDLMADDAPQGNASVEGDYISWSRIQQIFNDKVARVQAVKTCFMAFMADENLKTDGKRNAFYNSKQKPTNKVTDLRTFIHKVLGMSWFNLAGIASTRGNDLASNNVLLKADNQTLYNTNVLYSTLYAIVAVEAGVKVFNHDLRKYISDDTIENIRDLAIDTTDLSHASASTNGWNLPYQRGEQQSDRMSLDDLLGSDFTL